MLGQCQVIMATQIVVEFCPNPDGLSGRPPAGFEQIRARSRDDRADPHYRIMREFCAAPATFVETMMEE
jgi:hypothetical protein